MHFAYWGKVVLFFQSDKCCCLVSVSQPSQGPCGVQGHLGWASNSHPTPTDAPGRQQGAVCVLKSPLFTWEPQVEFQLPAAVAQPSPWELTVDREICPLPAHSECVQGGGSSPHGFFFLVFRTSPRGARPVLTQWVACATTCPLQSPLALCWRTPSMRSCTSCSCWVPVPSSPKPGSRSRVPLPRT